MENHVLILGAGINGAAIARELAINGVGVTIVDTADVASGATAYSSRLIHGGLRYLEYGEFDLVRESLEERTRLLRLAPQFVRPLRLIIPVSGRFGGLGPTARRFLGWETKSDRAHSPRRGLWLVRMGLRMYDAYARDPTLPRYEVHRAGAGSSPAIDRDKYGWLCSYWDAQIQYPERFVVALFEDARRAAAENGSHFELCTYHSVRTDGPRVELVSPDAPSDIKKAFAPSAVINATGAWVDHTLAQLRVNAKPLMGGTKGSHFFTHNSRLREALGGDAIYAEAADGRPVFVLPFGEGTLVGTTDVRFEGDPHDAVASEEELRYLLDTANALVPSAGLKPEDIAFHYSGVRPLPAVKSGKTAAITRRHWLEEHADAPWPLYSVIGGKLTTCRSLAQSAAATVLKNLNQPIRATSADRPVPGATGFPADAVARATLFARWARERKFSPEQLKAMFALVGMELEDFLASEPLGKSESISGTHYPEAFVLWLCSREHVKRLTDLVERRLMLMYEPGLSMKTLEELAALLNMPAAEIQEARVRLESFYGIRLA